MSSKFFRTGDDTSSESSSDEEELYSEEEEEQQEDSSEEDSDEQEDSDDDSDSSDDEGVKKKGANAFLKGDSDSESDSDDERAKVVKSAKDKRFEELEGTIKAIDNGKKINDWGSISSGTFMPRSKEMVQLLTKMPQSSTSSTARLPSSSRAARCQSHTSRPSPSSRTS